jgi:hypothetical protein
MNGKRLTRRMKHLLASRKLNPDNWLYVKNLPGELHLMHRHSGKVRVLNLERRVG